MNKFNSYVKLTMFPILGVQHQPFVIIFVKIPSRELN
jgi:hypothetical protein